MIRLATSTQVLADQSIASENRTSHGVVLTGRGDRWHSRQTLLSRCRGIDSVMPIPPDAESVIPDAGAISQCRAAADHHGIGMPAVGPLTEQRHFDVSGHKWAVIACQGPWSGRWRRRWGQIRYSGKRRGTGAIEAPRRSKVAGCNMLGWRFQPRQCDIPHRMPSTGLNRRTN